MPSSAAFSPVPPETQTPFLRVAHLVRPAQGGMRVQVRTLLMQFPRSLLAAPRSVCDFCADVTEENNRFLLPDAHSNRPDVLLQNGARAGIWAKRSGAQILHGHGLHWLPLFASAQIASGLPMVFTLHNLVPDDLSRPQKVVLRAAFARASRILCVSEAVAESAKNLTGTNKIVVVRNGVDAARFEGSLPPRADFRAKGGVPADALIVLCVARLSPEKGLLTLLHAAALLHESVPNVRVFIAGNGPQKEELEAKAQELHLSETVTFLGQKSAEQIADLLRAAGIYVQPSLAEGLGIAAIEAMASGLPVVASRVGGLPEVVAHGETGFLVPFGKPDFLADALKTLCFNADARAKMGQAGRARAVSHFGLAQTIKETQAVYQAALKSPQTGRR